MSKKILIVDDEPGLLKIISLAIKENGYLSIEASSAEEALKFIETESIDAVISDIRMPGISGIDLLLKVKEYSPTTGFILLTAYASLDSAISALRAGADDYLTKPFEVEELLIRLNKTIKQYEIQRETSYLRKKFVIEEKKIIGLKGGLKTIYENIKKVAKTDATIMLYGESGTGKEVFAKIIHQISKRKNNAIVTINCAAIPETLLESELFGYKIGAYTGAVTDKDGLFKVADNGTLFLDEISEISQAIQVKMLRAIQEKEIIPLGATLPLKINVRIIVATNRNLKTLVENKSFREDLYYRINVVSIEIPPLRERREDIIPLAEYFLNRFSKKYGKKKNFSTKMLRYLVKEDWKGNVRELENYIEKAVIFSEGKEITININDNFKKKKKFIGSTLADIEKETILKNLQLTNYDKKRTSEMLDIDLSTLYRKIKKYDL